MKDLRWFKLCNRIVFVAALFIFLSSGAWSMEVAGVNVPQTLSIENNTLDLNGAGIRKKFFFKIYVGALYLPVKKSNVDAILADPGAKSVIMTFLYKEVEAEKLVEGWNEGFANNSSAEDLKSLQERIDRFNSLFPTVRRGDEIRLEYLPGEGTRIMINNSLKGVIEGEDFSRALLKIWLGKEPADVGLRDAMLGYSY